MNARIALLFLPLWVGVSPLGCRTTAPPPASVGDARRGAVGLQWAEVEVVDGCFRPALVRAAPGVPLNLRIVNAGWTVRHTLLVEGRGAVSLAPQTSASIEVLPRIGERVRFSCIEKGHDRREEGAVVVEGARPRGRSQ